MRARSDPLRLVSQTSAQNRVRQDRCYSNRLNQIIAKARTRKGRNEQPAVEYRHRRRFGNYFGSDIAERDKALKSYEKAPRTPIRCSLDCHHHCTQNIETVHATNATHGKKQLIRQSNLSALSPLPPTPITPYLHSTQTYSHLHISETQKKRKLLE